MVVLLLLLLQNLLHGFATILLGRCADSGKLIACCRAGVRQDNRVAERAGSMQKRGYRFFADEEDEHGLEDLLQALCFLECESTWVPAKPWEAGSMGAHISGLHLLPAPVQKLLQNLIKEG